MLIDIIGQSCSKFQIGTFESMAWHPNEENVLFVSNSLEDRHGQAQVYFQARNVENSQYFTVKVEIETQIPLKYKKTQNFMIL